MQDLTHYIDGAHARGSSGRVSDVFDPATGEVQARCPLASPEEMAQAVAVAGRRSRPGAPPTRSAGRG